PPVASGSRGARAAAPPRTDHAKGLWSCSATHGWKWSEIDANSKPASSAASAWATRSRAPRISVINFKPKMVTTRGVPSPGASQSGGRLHRLVADSPELLVVAAVLTLSGQLTELHGARVLDHMTNPHRGRPQHPLQCGEPADRCRQDHQRMRKAAADDEAVGGRDGVDGPAHLVRNRQLVDHARLRMLGAP